jgi:hypothetical protein
MAAIAQFAGWLATQVFDVVGQVAGQPADDGGAYSDTVDLQVGKTVYHDVPASMRMELWLSQLQRKSARGPAVMAEYRDSLFEKLAPEVLGEIEKDTHRTFPHHPRLSTEEGQRAMLNVLRAYALSDPEIGYTQVCAWEMTCAGRCGHVNMSVAGAGLLLTGAAAATAQLSGGP